MEWGQLKKQIERMREERTATRAAPIVSASGSNAECESVRSHDLRAHQAARRGRQRSRQGDEEEAQEDESEKGGSAMRDDWADGSGELNVVESKLDEVSDHAR